MLHSDALIAKLEIAGEKAEACIIDIGLPLFMKAPARGGDYKTS